MTISMKSYMALSLGLLIMVAPTAHAIEMEDMAVPAATGVLSGYMYGKFLKEGQWIAFLLSMIVSGQCKEYIFKSFDKKGADSYSKRLASMLSVSCTAKKDKDGVTHSTYVFNVNGDTQDEAATRYSTMAEIDSLVSMVTALIKIIS